ncbi:universal stress protein [Salinigranum salinum]|uniref:universal stress protein n=1 Tax=Salinigranum salinum TaxID=1364937 RepID=UPI001260FA06|nr:universal stress protein [Salinigranum salinum]
MPDRPSVTPFERALVPIASEEDVRRARETILPYLDDAGGVAILVHVIKVTEGGIDPSPADLQAEEAERLFETVSENYEDVVVETRKAYGSDVVTSIVETATETDATAIVFSPQEKGLLLRLLTGDTARSLMTRATVPVVSIPHGTA